VLACGIAANQLAWHRQIFHPRPYRRVAIALEDVRLKLARTCQHPVACGLVAAQRRTRHQLIGLRAPELELRHVGEKLSQGIRALVALGAAAGAPRNLAFVKYLDRLLRMAFARMYRRIKEHQRVPTPAHLQRMHYRSDRGERMEYPSHRPSAPLLADSMPDAF